MSTKILKASLGKGILFQDHGNLNITSYSNADWLDLSMTSVQQLAIGCLLGKHCYMED